MKSASGAEAQAFKSSPASSSVSSGSNWDVCSENSLAIDGRGAIPYETLAASGIPKDVADQLNYRNLEPSEVQEILGHPISGCWGVKYTNADGSDTLVDGVPFARVRRPDGSEPKYLTPEGAGNRSYFSPLLKPAILNGGKPLMIAEGEKGTDSANHHGFACVGLAGVYSFKDKASRAGLPELKEVNFKNGRQILIVFDSDITTNPHVLEAAFQVAEWVCRRGATPLIVQLPCELDGRKNGVDDFLARHGADALQRLIDIAQPAGHLKESKQPEEPDDFVRTWEPEPMNDHLVAQMLLTEMEGLYAINPRLGTFKWETRQWNRLTSRHPMRHPIHQWMDKMRFHTRGKNRIDSIAAEVGAYLEEWDWDNPELMSFENGTYNIRTNAFVSSHDPDDYLTHSFDYPFDRQAKCPTFQAFINDTFPADEVDVLRGMMRWTVIPKDRNRPYRHEKSVDVIGAKGAGKGTLAESLISVCGGDHGVGTLDTDQISNPNVRAGLIGKKGAVDVDASGVVTNPGMFNKVVSNEVVPIKILYLDCSDARLGVVVWRFMNDQPKVKNTGGVEGMARRIISLAIKKKPKKKDTRLKAKLFAERAGILQWLLQMTDQEMHASIEGAGRVASIAAASVEAQLMANPWLQFFLDCYPDGYMKLGSNGKAEMPALVLYDQYKKYMQDRGLKPTSMTTFGGDINRLVERGTLHKDRKSSGLVYIITPFRYLDLPKFFGMDVDHVDDDPTQHPDLLPGSTSQNGNGVNGSAPTMQTMKGLRPLDTKSKKVANSHLKPVLKKVQCASPTSSTSDRIYTNTPLVQMAIDAGCNDLDEVIDWVPKNRHMKIGRRDAERSFKAIKRAESAEA